MGKNTPVAEQVPVGDLEKSQKMLARSRFFGRVSAIVFFLAALAIIDALQTLMRQEFNHIDALPGERISVAGVLPAGMTSHEGMQIIVEGDPGVSLLPFETYKGFWMGGNMWRASLVVAPDAGVTGGGESAGMHGENGSVPGNAIVTIVDYLPLKKGTQASTDSEPELGQQNPALVYTVTIWPSEAARRAADISFCRRFTGFPAFFLAGLSVGLALLAGLANWKTFSLAERGLAGHGIFFIHGIKELIAGAKADGAEESGSKVAFARLGRSLVVGDKVALVDRSWRECSEGRIVELTDIKGFALFPKEGVTPQYGWLVRLLHLE